MGILLEILLLFILIKIFYFSHLSPDSELLNEIDRIKVSHSTKNDNDKKPKKRDLKSTIYSYNLNCSTIYITVSDFEILFRRGIITENQAIMLWENLLNIKTERNLEWLEYSKIITTNSNGHNPHNEKDNQYLQYLFIFFNNDEFTITSLYYYILEICFYFLTKYFFRYPKFNIVSLTALLIFNLVNSIYFYDLKFYFTSCIFLCSFISNIYFIYLNLAILCGENEVDLSIFYVHHFKTKYHYYLKIFICFFMLLIIIYLTSVHLRFHLNYILSFFLLEKMRELIQNYNSLATYKFAQPMNSFISLIFGAIVFIYTNIFYSMNIPFSYELNSLLFINNMITFYYLTSLDKYIYIQRNFLIEAHIESEQIPDQREKVKVFEEYKKKINIERYYRSDLFIEGNEIDFIIMIFCLEFLFLGFLFNTYFYIVISFFFLHTLHKNCLLFLNIKIARILSSFILISYLFLISNMESISFSYINEIIALYDQKFLDALMQLIKLSFYFVIAICIYISEDFVDLFNIYNYSSYKYLFREISFPNNSKLQKVLNTVYKFSDVINEIIDYDINTSIAKVQAVLGTINDGSSNINELYIETLLTQASSNAYCFILISDYMINYFTLFLLSDIFSQSTNPFVYLAYLLHRLGIYAKLFALFFEYSKTQMQKNIYVVMNLIFMERLFYFVDNDYIDNIIIHFFKIGNFFLYFLVLKGNAWMNLFLLMFFWVYYNSQVDSVFGLPFVLSVIVSKISVQICKVHQCRSVMYGIVTVLCLTMFSMMNYETIKWFNVNLRYFSVKTIGTDIIGHFEKFVFVGKEKNEYIEIKSVHFIKDTLLRIRSLWDF